MSLTQSLSFYEKFISLKRAKEKLDQKKSKYLSFIREMYSISEAEEKAQSLEEKTEKLKGKIELGNLFFIDVSCLLLFALVGFQWSFQKYADLYAVISVSAVCILALAIFFNIHRNKIKFCNEQILLVKKCFDELANPAKYYEQLGVETLKITLGKDIAPLADTDANGNLIPRLVGLRKQLVDELGYIIPNVRFLQSSENEPKEYDIWVRGKLVAKGDVSGEKPDFLDDADVIVGHLKKAVIEHVDYIFTLSDVYRLTELVKSKDEALINTLSEYVDSLDLRNILVKLIKLKKSIKDVEFVYQRIADYARFTAETDEIAKKIKADLDKLVSIGKDLV